MLSESERTCSPPRSRTSKSVFSQIQPRLHEEKKTNKSSLLGFFVGVLSGGHVAGEEGAAGGVAAIPIDETTMLVS